MADLSSFRLDHIGIAVSNLEQAANIYKLLGFSEMYQEEVVSEGVRVGMFELANQSRLELLEPLSDQSPVARFLEKRGSGVHHICLGVDNLAEVLEKLKSAGVRLIYDQPRKGAHHCLISFIHPSAAGGVLIELSQKIPYQAEDESADMGENKSNRDRS